LKINVAILSILNIDYKKKILFILKCYVLDQTSMLKGIYLISNEKNDNINIYYKISIKKIKKMKLYDFDN
jgi:glycerol-3-phosphate responsive antiterminator